MIYLQRNGEFKRLKIGRDNESEDQQKAFGRHSQGGRSAEEKFKISLFGDDGKYFKHFVLAIYV